MKGEQIKVVLKVVFCNCKIKCRFLKDLCGDAPFGNCFYFFVSFTSLLFYLFIYLFILSAYVCMTSKSSRLLDEARMNGS